MDNHQILDIQDGKSSEAIAGGFRYKEHFKKMILFVFGTIKHAIPCKIT
jgi:hypothetical protein